MNLLLFEKVFENEFINIMKNRIRDFQIQHKLGSGSYGVIYKALHKTTRQVCVLKQISLARLNQKARKSAINQATIMGKLSHPFIVRYQDSFTEDNTLNIVMEYCDNGDLAQHLKLQNKKPLKQQKIWKLFISICMGLQYIHKNRILHRDIKTLNIFMNRNQQIKIGDLGVAKMLTSQQFAQTIVGTPFYLSPQLCQEKPYNQKSDIWALGCLLYQLCTYRHPFQAQNQGSLILKIIRGKYAPIPEFYSNQLKQVINLCLERDYKRRPTTSNLLAKPKIVEYMQQFGIQQIVRDYYRNVGSDKVGPNNLINSIGDNKTNQSSNINSANNQNSSNNKVIVRPQSHLAQPNLKSNKQIPQKIVKALDNEPKPQPKKQIKPQPKAQEKKKQPPMKPPTSQKKIQHPQSKIKTQDISQPRQSKQQFMANLQKMIEENQGKKQIIKQGPTYAQLQNKVVLQARKQDRLQRVAARVQQLKKQKIIQNLKANQPKRYTPQLPQKKPSMPAPSFKKIQPIISSSQDRFAKPHFDDKARPHIDDKARPPIPKPPMPISHNKQVISVKQEKKVQHKVYQYSRNSQKSQGVIKSGGFSSIQQNRQKIISNSRQKVAIQRIMPQRKPTVPTDISQIDQPKQLFGPSPTIQHKSQKNIRKAQQPKFIKKQQSNKISRVRKGGSNQLARNARNASRYGVSKQQQDIVANLPTNIGNREADSSDQEVSTERGRVDVKGKTNRKFQLKEIDHNLVVQKYEDIMNSQENKEDQQDGRQGLQTEQTGFENQKEPQQQQQTNQMNRQTDRDMQKDEVVQGEAQYVQQQLQYASRNSPRQQTIQQMLQSQIHNEDYHQQQYPRQSSNIQPKMQNSQWSFQQQLQMPQMQREQGCFQQNNPYLVQGQQTADTRITYLQAKLAQNMKRQDQINKLMQIKMDQCRAFITSQKIFQQILVFFRTKLNMDDEYTDNDQKQIQLFLKKNGLTDHRKFQNIYKIMHFQMQLQNTRKIIQRICKKLSELDTNQE